MHGTGCLGLVHWGDPKGWDGEGGGKGFRMGNTCTPMADSYQCMVKPLQYCKVISLQLKWINLLKNKIIKINGEKIKSGDITLPTKVCLVKAMVFPVVMYGCESWTTKKAEHQRNHAFELWCWRRLLRVPWKTRRSNQSILKEISPEYSLKDWCWSWNSKTLATWCKELIHLKAPDAGKDWRQEEKGTTEV